MVEYLEIVIVATRAKVSDRKNVIVNSPEILYSGKIGNGLLLTTPFGIFPRNNNFYRVPLLNRFRTTFIPQSPGTVQLILSNESRSEIDTVSVGIAGNNTTTLAESSLHESRNCRGYWQKTILSHNKQEVQFVLYKERK